MKPTYEDFFLVVDGKAGAYTVGARGPSGVEVSPVPFEYRETEEFTLALNQIRMGFAPSSERMKEVGTTLFRALFPLEIATAYGRVQGSLRPQVGLRLKLIIRTPELNRLPWELMYNVLNQSYLAATQSHALVRFITNWQPAASLLTRRPLRVLYLQANPEGTNQLDAVASEEAIKEGLGDTAEVTVVRSATPSALRNALREGSYHVFHYDGHGAFDESSDTGHLFLHDRDGREHTVQGDQLVGYLDGSAIRLVVLSACETAAESQEKRFAGIAHKLARSTRLPAVVAMQYEIPDASAVAFTRGFYEALADDYPVDAAVVQGRQAILESLGADPFGSPDWATPVLFLRVEDGNIFLSENEEEETMSDSKKEGEKPDVDTGGGAFIGGSVNTGGGKFVGRDDRSSDINVGNVSGSGIAIGHGAQASVQQGAGVAELAQLFATIYEKIDQRGDDPDVSKDEITGKVKDIEQEAAKGKAANDAKVKRWLGNLGEMAPDILNVTVSALANPAAGAAQAIRLIAQKALQERG